MELVFHCECVELDTFTKTNANIYSVYIPQQIAKQERENKNINLNWSLYGRYFETVHWIILKTLNSQSYRLQQYEYELSD